MKTLIGSHRVVDVLAGEMLPRIVNIYLSTLPTLEYRLQYRHA